MKQALLWLARPLFSRGRYSPRLTMAWVVLLYTLRVIEKWLGTSTTIIKGVLIMPAPIVELIAVLLGFVGLLLGLGTLQKVQLGDVAPSPGAIEAESNHSDPHATDQTA